MPHRDAGRPRPRLTILSLITAVAVAVGLAAWLAPTPAGPPSMVYPLGDCQRPGPGKAVAVTGCLFGAGGLVEAKAHEDIRLLNERIKLAIATASQDAQSPGPDKGHILDASTWSGVDGIDWLSVGYMEPVRSHPRVGSKVRHHQRIKYDRVVARNHRSGAKAEVVATGYWQRMAGVRVTTTYELDQGSDYVKITSEFYNGTSDRADFFFGDVMDYDGAGERSYVPGVGPLLRPERRRLFTADSWMGMWGAGPTGYALFYEDPMVVIGNSSWLKSSRRFELRPGQRASLVRYLVIKDATEYGNDHLAAIKSTLENFPACPEVAAATITVTDQSGRPLAGARVMLDRDIANAMEELTEGVSGPDGKVTLRTRPGVHVLQVYKPGYHRLPPRDIHLPRGPSNWPLDLHPRAGRPIEHVILIIADGVSWRVFNEEIKKLPAAERAAMLPAMAAVGRGASEVPSITAVNKATILTGAHAHTHGVVGNVFCRNRLAFVDSLAGAAKRAGLTYATSRRSGLLRRIAKGALPSISLWWCYDTDQIGHKYGEDSPEYRKAVKKMLAAVGEIRRALTKAGMAESTVLAFGSDHGHMRLMPPAKWKCKECGHAFWGRTALPDACSSCGAAAGFDNIFQPTDTGRVVDLRHRLEAAGIPRDAFTWFGSGPRMAHIVLRDPDRATAVKKLLAGGQGVDRVFLRAELDRAELKPGVRAYLGHPNAGQVIAFAAPQYSFGRSKARVKADCLSSKRCLMRGGCLGLYWDTKKGSQGGHGGLDDRESYVPFVLWGPSVKPGPKPGLRANADWAATICALLEIAPPHHSEGAPAIDFLHNQPPRIKIDRPRQTLAEGRDMRPVKVEIDDRESSGLTLHYSWIRDHGLETPGLPKGVSLSEEKAAGQAVGRRLVISGKPSGPPGVYRVIIRARDNATPAPPALTTRVAVTLRVDGRGPQQHANSGR